MKDIDKKVLLKGIGFVMALALIFYITTSALPKALVFLTKATSDQIISAKNSILIGEKVFAKADEKDECVVIVFVLGKDNKGIMGKQVKLTGLGVLEGKTDSLGKVVFQMKTTEAGQYQLIASVDGVQLTKTAKVTFR